MKKLTFQIAAIAFVAVSVLFTSCSKEGPEGPAGATGAPGPTGAQGPAGAKGDKGDPGTANVIYSSWLNVTFNNGIGQISAPKLTKDILNSGEIKVYWNMYTSDDPFIVQVPCVVPLVIFTGNEDDQDESDIYIDPYFETGAIHLIANYNLTSNNGVSQFRYILIPGGTAARKPGPAVGWSDYNGVKKYLKLKK